MKIKKAPKKLLGQFLFMVLITAALLFGSAGTLAWWNGWAFLAVQIFVGVLSVDVFRNSPELAEERKDADKKAEPMEKLFVLLLSIILPTLLIVIAGLDRRFGWSGSQPTFYSFSAFLLMLAGGAVTYWAMKSNPFFSSQVRIQKERGHTVVSRGPYAYIRHPGYSGAILFNLASPLLLGSIPAFGIGVLILMLLIVRTILEDKKLQSELKGYRQYAVKVRYKLIPLIW